MWLFVFVSWSCDVTARTTCCNNVPLLSADEKISWRKVKLLCACTWLYALAWAAFPFLGWGRYGPEPYGLSCSLAWGQMKHEGFSFVVSMFSLNLVLPCVIIAGCYFGIAFKLYFTYRKSNNNSNRLPNVVRRHRRLLAVGHSSSRPPSRRFPLSRLTPPLLLFSCRSPCS